MQEKYRNACVISTSASWLLTHACWEQKYIRKLFARCRKKLYTTNSFNAPLLTGGCNAITSM